MLRNVIILLVGLSLFPCEVLSQPHTTRVVDGVRVTADTHPYVAKLFLDGNGFCTGTLITPVHVLTAAHCFFNHQNERVVADERVLVEFANGEYLSKKVFIHPNYVHRSRACVEGEPDLAVIELASFVTDIDPALVDDLPPSFTETYTLVGYGYEGTGQQGETIIPPPEGIVNEGSIQIESRTKNYVSWQFRRGTGLSNAAGGDSGAPLFRFEDDRPVVTSVHCGGTGFAQFGTYSDNARVDTEIEWLSAVVLSFLNPTPPKLIGFFDASSAVGEEFSFRLLSGGQRPLEFEVNNLPPGLSFDGELISGTPTKRGRYKVELVARNSLGEDCKTLNVSVFNFVPKITTTRSTWGLFPNFTNSDRIIMRGNIKLPKRFRPRGKKVRLQIGSFTQRFRLNKKGESRKRSSLFRIKKGRDGNGKFLFKIQNATLYSTLERVGIINPVETEGRISVFLPLEIDINKAQAFDALEIQHYRKQEIWRGSSVRFSEE